jgi:DNA modification methylase
VVTPPCEIVCGDCREALKALPAESVQCCVTSPAYYGLRDYKTGKWEGGDPACDHKQETAHQTQGVSSQRRGRANTGEQRNETFKLVCGKCGAMRVDRQIGMERTVEEYVASLVAVFREVRRVLRADGTLWLNIGDSFVRQAGDDATRGTPNTGQAAVKLAGCDRSGMGNNVPPPGFKPKDLLGVPWRVAFALQTDGWTLRCDIIWHKPNGMPESVRDRPTRNHEYVFLLSKSPTYYYDAEAIKEEASDATLLEMEQGYQGHLGLKGYEAAGEQNPSTVKERIIANARKRADQFGGTKHNGDTSKHSDGSIYTGKVMVNKRSVWTVNTVPLREEHFAAFPSALVKTCVLAGSRPGDTVLDPFVGSGTVCMVAQELGRASVGVDLNPEYCALARRRCAVTPGLAI